MGSFGCPEIGWSGLPDGAWRAPSWQLLKSGTEYMDARQKNLVPAEPARTTLPVVRMHRPENDQPNDDGGHDQQW
jgi:hypothetical protein